MPVRPLSTAALLLLVGGLAWAQNGPHFEVASIRPTATSPGSVRLGFQATANQVRVTAMSIKDYLVVAYRIRPQQITGPDWMGQQRFDVVATIPDGVPGSQIPEMLQALLAERFQLKLHHETRDLPVYVLGVGKAGVKLPESAPAPTAPAGGPVTISGGGNASGVSVDMGGGASFTFASNQLQMHHVTATQVAGVLTRFVDRPVVDQTGLTGTYDVTLDVTQEDYNAMLVRSAVNAGVLLPPQAMRVLETASPDTVSAPLQRFGLTFEARKAPLDVIVVDSASKTPTEN